LILRREKDNISRKCAVAGCNAKEGMGYNFHGFPMKNPAFSTKWVKAVHQIGTASLLCSKHECFDTDGGCHREKVGMKAKRASLKWGAIHIPKINDDSSSSCQTGRPASERRK